MVVGAELDLEVRSPATAIERGLELLDTRTDLEQIKLVVEKKNL
jgi:hypothetical protein